MTEVLKYHLFKRNSSHYTSFIIPSDETLKEIIKKLIREKDDDE